MMKLFKSSFFFIFFLISVPLYAYDLGPYFTINGQLDGQGGFGAESVQNSKTVLNGGGLARFKINQNSNSQYYLGSQLHLVLGQNFASYPYLKQPQNWIYRVKPLVWYPGKSTGKEQTTIYIDRLNTAFSIANGTLTIGRQAISFGKDFFWSPLDIFRPFQPAQVDRDYKSGTDAIRYDYSLGTLSGLNFIIAPAEDSDGGNITWDSSALVARAYSNVKGFDVSALGGKMIASYLVGGGFAGDINGIELRGEGLTYFYQKSNKIKLPLKNTNFMGVLGTGYSWTNTLAISLEYFYNSIGVWDFYNGPQVAKAADLYFLGLIPNFSENLVGTSITYDFTPIITGRFSTIVSIADSSSVMIQPDVVYSILDNVDLVAAFSLGLGKSTVFVHNMPTTMRSDFGNLPYVLLFQLKYYW